MIHERRRLGWVCEGSVCEARHEPNSRTVPVLALLDLLSSW